MELKLYKNKYGWGRVDCHICKAEVRAQESANPKKQLAGIYNHILLESKKEIWQKSLAGDSTTEPVATPHFDYYKAHTKEGVVVKATKREFDDDIEVK